MPQSFLLTFLFCACMVAQNHDETFRNEKVAIVEGSIAPGAVEAPLNYPSVIVYTQGGRRGEVVFRPQLGEAVKNTGTSETRYVRIDLLGQGAPKAAHWGTAGLSPHYKLLFENQYA